MPGNVKAGRITAVLGPTNTGKTHYAIERMLAHRTGVIGLPLRLLAREVYDRIVKARGPSVVALVTGEERIVPERAQYWVCTTEAMPEVGADFVAIDEIQLCADPERGHVFTDRLLHMRGLHETMLLGSHSMRQAIAALLPGVEFVRRERFSTLRWAGSKKISRMKPRAAIVGFSLDNVYAIAELIRRQKGGAAVVMGALSPRTRNAQVELYQNGDVDFLVATDAIGMGLNLDIEHVAFSATVKFDGRRMRHLFPHELGQIAGRAGRHTQDGTFGVTGEAETLPEDLIEAIEEHRFAPIERLQWRNPRLEFGTLGRLIESLEAPPQDERLTRGREADDLRALKALGAIGEITDRLRHPSDVRLLWDVCRIPDFRSVSETEHATLLARIFGFLQTGKGVPSDWLAAQIARIDRPTGDIDTLSKRLAFIRTWTYVAQRKGWVDDETHWREETRAVEDRLSDALHGALTQRFVDRRTSVLLRRLKQKETLVAEVNDKGEVTVAGEFAGRLEGFRFRQDATSSPDEARMLARAAYEALRPEFSLRSDRFYNAPDTEMDFTEQGGLMWGAMAVGKLVKGNEPLKPGVEAFVDEEAGPEVMEKVRRRLQHFIDRKVAALFDPMLAMGRDEALTGLARGFAFRLTEAMGILPREGVAAEVKELDQEARGLLRKHGVRFGQYTIFQQALLKPAPTRLRLVLASLWDGLDTFPESPPPGLVTIPYIADIPASAYTRSGYRPAGSRAIRIDMLERLADILRTQDSRGGFEATPDMLSITGMTLEQFADLMAGLGYKGEKGEREKTRVAAPVKLPEASSDNPIPEEASPLAEAEAVAETGEAEAAAAPEMEAFYTFTWSPRPAARAPRGEHHGERGPRRAPRANDGGAPRAHDGGAPRAGEGAAPAAEAGGEAAGEPGKGRRGGDRFADKGEKRSGGRNETRGEKRFEGNRDGNRDGGPKPKREGDEGRDGKFGASSKGGPKGGKFDAKGPRPPRDDKPRGFEAHPPKRDKPIDPDNPFAAALMGFKDKL